MEWNLQQSAEGATRTSSPTACWTAALAEVDELVDVLGKPVDQGIKVVVAALRYREFATSASCEGHLHHGHPYPWVAVDVDDGLSEEGRPLRLRNLAQRARLTRLIHGFYRERRNVPVLRLGFRDLSRGAFRLQPGRSMSSELPLEMRRTMLLRYRDEMTAFAEYLKGDSR